MVAHEQSMGISSSGTSGQQLHQEAAEAFVLGHLTHWLSARTPRLYVPPLSRAGRPGLDVS